MIVGASDDKTGNVKYGGDWIMESTMEDIQNVYFVENIQYYQYLLDGTYDDVGTGLRYIYVTNGLTASVGQTSTNTGGADVNIPSTINIDGTDYTVTSLFASAFVSTTNLTSITIPASVTSIGGLAFRNTRALTSITIPVNVTSIGGGAFWGATALTSVIFEAGSQLTTIGDFAFREAASLISITIPANVTSIGLEGFSNTPMLTSVIFEAGSKLTTFGNGVFFQATALLSIIIPSGVTSMGDGLFSLATSLTSVNIPPGITIIKGGTFSNTKLTSITISANITSIGNSAFQGSTLTSVIFEAGSKLTSIGDYAFLGASSLTSITIPASVINIGVSAFQQTSKMTSITFEAGSKLTSIKSSLFAGATSLTSVNIPPGVTSIGDYAFQGARSLTSIIIPATVTSIGQNAFLSVLALTSVTIPANVTSIGRDAFNNATALTSIIFEAGSKLTSIPSGMFLNATGFSSITIPPNVTSIASNAFQGATSLTDVYYFGSGLSLTYETPTSFFGATNVTIHNYDITSTAPVPVQLPTTTVTAIENEVPNIVITDPQATVINIPILANPTVLTSGTAAERVAKREVFFKDFFTKNSAAVAGKTLKMGKTELLGNSSIISKPNLQVFKAASSEVPIDTSILASDEGIYAFIDAIGDFIVLQMAAGKKLKVEKLNATQYNIYEDYVDTNTPVTDVMNVGETSSYNGFGYQIGSFVGPVDPDLIPIPICFPSGTPVVTDQGEVFMENLKPDVHTIQGKRIVSITETAPNFKHMICIEKDALGNNCPSARTEISPDHRVQYNGQMIKAKDLVGLCERVHTIPFIREKLYNVLMEQYDAMIVNNMVCETLHPDNILVQIASSPKYSNATKQELFNEYQRLLLSN